MENIKIDKETSGHGELSSTGYSKPKIWKKVHCPYCKKIFTVYELVEVHFPTCQKTNAQSGHTGEDFQTPIGK